MSEPVPFDPTVAQRRAADPARSVWVAASAGTGKTKVLTDRVLSLLLTGTLPHRLLCLTFTKAAAAEMANRINTRLAAWAAIDDEALTRDLTKLLGKPADRGLLTRARRLFAQVLDAPGGLRIETIHAFCQALLRRFPLEAGLAPHFAVMDDRDATEMLMAARDDVLAMAQAGDETRLSHAVEALAEALHESAFLPLLGEVIAARGRLVRFFARHDSLDAALAALARFLGVARGDNAEAALAAACAEEAFDGEALRRAAQAMAASVKDERPGAMAAWLSTPERRVDTLADWRAVFLTQKGEARKSLCPKSVETAWPGTAATMAAEAERLIALDARLRALATHQASASLLVVADALLAAYARRKAAAAALDYDDLILKTRALLEQDGGAAWVLYKLDGGIDHVLIDEAQDTNPDQWAVVKALTAEFFAGRGVRDEGRRTVFAVGDAKQSIYSFQGADPAEFEAMRAHLAERVPDSGGFWDEVALSVSFRSTRAVLAAVDRVFNTPEGRVGVLAEGETIRHHAARMKAGGSVELWPAIEPKEADAAEPWKPPVERSRGDNPRRRLARLVAARIAAMVSGESLDSARRRIRPGDIMVLVRRRNAFFEELVRELKALSVPVAGSDRMVLSEQMAVMDLMALGEALLLPEDDLTLACVLKGPLIGLTEEDLFKLAYGRPGSLYAAFAAARDAEPFATAWRTFSHWRNLAASLAPHEFYARVLTEGGKVRLLARLGPEAEDPLDEFMSLTLAHERMHPPSLQGFLAWMKAGGVEIKRDLEASSSLVRIMTVHGAKGLQAPIVFLPDTLQAPTGLPGLLWARDGAEEMPVWAPRLGDLADPGRRARDRAAAARDREYRRLLYVAMTRAEDRLILCGWKTRRAAPGHCWYALVKGALDGKAVPVEDPFMATRSETSGTVILRLACAQEETPAPGAVVAPPAEDRPLPDWARRKPIAEAATTRPLAPSRPDGAEPAVRSPLVAETGMGSFTRGRLVHRLLQLLPDLPPAEWTAATTRFLGRALWGLGRAEQIDIAIEVKRVLDDPAWSELFGPSSLAEVPVVGMIGDRVVSGQIDRLVVKPDEVLIVDFKTNRAPPRSVAGIAPLYLRQLAAYRALLAALYPNRRVRCALLWTEGPSLLPVPGALLDDALAGLMAPEGPGR